MRCKKHITDRSSSVGVCASCLRERLFALIAAQALADETHHHRKSTDPNPNPNPPPLIFPRSVSPYICRRSDDSSWNNSQHNHNDRRFYSTPQVGPTSNTFFTDAAIINKKKKQGKFSLFSNIFRSSSRSDDLEQDPRVSTISRASLSTSTSSPISSTWFSSIISGRRKKQSRLFSHDDAAPPTTNHRRPCRTRDRGMSPSCEDEDYTDKEGSPSASGYSSESSQGWRKAAAAVTSTPGRRKGQSQHNRNVSGMAFCLSPLVRASPNNHRSQKDVPPGGVGFSGEINGGRVCSNKPHLSAAASFCANRSRKLANFGRYNTNNYNP